MTEQAEKEAQDYVYLDKADAAFVAHARRYDEFKEAKELTDLFASIKNIYKNQIAVEKAIEKCQIILDEYQMQPQLIDPHLESLITQLIDIVKDESNPPEVVHISFRCMYIITKTRGYKVIVRYLPHEVADLEPLLAMLAKQCPTDHKTWETRYMLLVWLSIVCIIPFDMVRLDSNQRTAEGEVRKPITDRIIDVGKEYLEVTSKTRDAAAYMLSKFITRPDLKKSKLPEFLDWALTRIHTFNKDSTSGQAKIMGILSTIALLFKHGKRDDLVTYASNVLEQVTALNLLDSKNSTVRKYSVKIVQRIALTFLKAKVAAWRYQRGSRSLATNLMSNTPAAGQETLKTAEDEEEEYDIPDEMEEVIEQLLNGLRDEATIVRWSAAKGIGRVTGRLPQELADEVVGSIMELCSITEIDTAWHGGCLALAELGRRGLLLPHRLPDVVPVILRALAYDEKRGNHSVGTHVRDAACYVCWSFARAYEPNDIKPYVTEIASALLIAAVFDREVNVRRAAAAAFQENVGRQGQFPHGIDIVVNVDYFAVGNRTDAYLNLSVYLAQFEEYTHPLIDHLYKIKYNHWDIKMRETAAMALNRLTVKAPSYIIETVLPKMLEECTSVDLSNRQGAILMVAEAIPALADIAEKQNKNVSELIGEKMTNDIRMLTAKFHDAQLFRGTGGEIMRKAVCALIQNMAMAKMPFNKDPVIETWQNMIDECLQYKEPDVQKAAVLAIPAFCSFYYQGEDGRAIPEIQEKLLSRYLRELGNTQETIRMGFTQAVGALPKSMLQGRLMEVIADLINASLISPKFVKFAEARRDAITALASVCKTMGVDMNGTPNEVICPSSIILVYNAFFDATKDYTLDNRGDVGSWVREASMTAMSEVTSLLVNYNPKLIPEECVEKIFCCLFQQASEKIDRVRALAGEIVLNLLYHTPEVPHIPDREKLMNIFVKEKLLIHTLAAPNITFPLMVQLLGLPTYAYSTLLGLTVSVGGLTESLVKHSSLWLNKWLRDNVHDMAQCEWFCGLVLRICTDYEKNNRVIYPMMKMLDQLLANGCFNPLLDTPNHTFPDKLLAVCKLEATKCGDPQKLLSIIDVCSGLLQFSGDVRQKTMQQLLIFMCHKYPIVRSQAAQRLYETLITYDDIVDAEKLDEVMSILSETEWNTPLDKVRPVRNQLCDMLNVPRPKLVAKKEPEGAVVEKMSSVSATPVIPPSPTCSPFKVLPPIGSAGRERTGAGEKNPENS